MQRLDKLHSLDARRQYPRLKIDIKAFVISQSGNEFPAVIQDISPDGVQITYKGKGDKLLFEKSVKHDDLKNLKVKLIFNLPFFIHEEIKIDAHLIHHHRLGDCTYVAGLLFAHDDIEQKDKILGFLNYETEPNNEELLELCGTTLLDRPIQDQTDKDIKKEITLKTKVEKENTSNHRVKMDSGRDLSKELTIMTATLNSLVSSIKIIEDKLGCIEKKMSK